MMNNEMEMPCPCQKCGVWFDLNEGLTSYLWYPNTVICEDCGEEERKEIERMERIQELQGMLENAISDIRYCHEQLIQLNANLSLKPLFELVKTLKS